MLTMRPALKILTIVGLWLLLILGCASPTLKNRNTQSAAKPSPTFKTVETVPSTRVDWTTDEYDDDMGRGRVRTAEVRSTNTISLDSPYDGEQHATLIIRKHPAYGTDVIIKIEKGQLLDSEYHSKVLVRFDDDKMLAFSSVGPDDLSSESLFLRGNVGSQFINRMKTAKRLRVQVPVYQGGMQQLEFNVRGFTW